MKIGAAAVAAVVVLLIVAACSGNGESATPTPAEEQTAPSTGGVTAVADHPGRPKLPPLVRGPVSPDGLRAILATGDLGVGANRVGFLLTSADGAVALPVAEVSSQYLAGSGGTTGPAERTTAEYRPWPIGSRGLYTTRLTFDRPGNWAIEIAVRNADGSVRRAQLVFEVGETPVAPSIGSAALKSKSKTINDVESIGELTTGALHDRDFYQVTIAEAVSSGRPTVIVFASPAFCTNAVCGPQLDVLQELKNGYRGQANFVHVDFFDNPAEVQRDLDAARLSPTVKEWNLPGIEWSFVIDRQGAVSDRFEAFATFDELEAALKRVL